jgi:hypothetical protein
MRRGAQVYGKVRARAQLRHLAPVLAAFAIALSLSLAGRAQAAERPYAYVQGVETLPQGGLELENWFGAVRPQGGGTSWEWWLGPVVGITDHLEAGLFGIFLQPVASDASQAFLQLDSIRFQLSYALADRGAWPVDVRVRLQVGVPAANDSLTTWASVYVARDFGHLNLTANLAGSNEIAKADGDVDWYFWYGLGASYAIVGAFRVGGELNGKADFSGDESFTFLGPSLAYAIGRIWASASYDFGLTSTSPHERGRIVVGLSF